MKYKIMQNEMILDTENDCWIPQVEDNRHYQEYLAWVAEGNTADVEATPE